MVAETTPQAATEVSQSGVTAMARARSARVSGTGRAGADGTASPVAWNHAA